MKKNSKQINAYSILKSFGNPELKKYINKKMDAEFDSHSFIQSFVKDHESSYKDMLAAHHADGDEKYRNTKISMLIGGYLWHNRIALGIQKISKSESPNLNGTKSITSKWCKI